MSSSFLPASVVSRSALVVSVLSDERRSSTRWLVNLDTCADGQRASKAVTPAEWTP